MKSVSKLLLIGTFAQILPWTAQAGGSVGNGGDVVVCQARGGVTVETLDLYEARTLRGLTPSLGDPKLSWQDKFALALARLEKVDPYRAAHYRDRVQQFTSEASFIPHIQLTDIPDSQQVLLPAQCSIAQIAVQKPPQFPGDPYYVISKDLWDQLDSENQAALVMHEIVYREAIEFGHTNSISARYFNSLILSDRLAAVTLNDYIHLLYRLPFKSATVRQLEINLEANDEAEFQPTGLPAAVEVFRASRYVQGRNWITVGAGEKAEFYDNGMLRRTVAIDGLWRQGGNDFAVHGQIRFFRASPLDTVTLARAQTIVIPGGSVVADGTVSFYESNGQFKEITDISDGSVDQKGTHYGSLQGRLSFDEVTSLIESLETRGSVQVRTARAQMMTAPGAIYFDNGFPVSFHLSSGSVHLSDQAPADNFELTPQSEITLTNNELSNPVQVTRGTWTVDGVRYSLAGPTDLKVSNFRIVEFSSDGLKPSSLTIQVGAVTLIYGGGTQRYILKSKAGSRSGYEFAWGYTNTASLSIAGVGVQTNAVTGFHILPHSISLQLSPDFDATHENGSPYLLHGFVELASVLGTPGGANPYRCGLEISFYDTGKIESCAIVYQPRGQTPITLETPQGRLAFGTYWGSGSRAPRAVSEFLFFETGLLRKGTLAADSTFVDATGATVTRPKGATIEFDANGKLIK